jgi:hypothetical protein
MSFRGLEMKHGDKAKAKSAKAKASGKEAGSKKAVAKSSKGAEKSSKAAQAVSKKASGKTPEKSSAPSNGKGKGARPAAGNGFTNPVIAEAFRRAVKKYPTAFRRLTD